MQLAYPDLYDITYSYTAFQQSQQGIAAFPGTQLDADLAGLDSSILGLSAFVQRAIRSDGALQNGLVTYDSLSVSLQARGIAPATAWATATGYLLGDAVTINSNLYRCLVDHTSGVFSTDLAAAKWVLVAALSSSGGTVYFDAYGVSTTASAADNTANIIAAIEGVPSGTTLVFTPGAYAINEISAEPLGHIRILGFGATLVNSTQTYNSAGGHNTPILRILPANSTYDVLIEGLAVTGPRLTSSVNRGEGTYGGDPLAPGAGFPSGIDIPRGNNVRVINCTVTGTYYAGVDIHYANNVVVAGNTINNHGFSGITISDSVKNDVFRNKIDDIGSVAPDDGYGINMSTSYNAPGYDYDNQVSSIHHNKVTNCKRKGIDVHNGVQGTIHDNFVKGCAYAHIQAICEDGAKTVGDWGIHDNHCEGDATFGDGETDSAAISVGSFNVNVTSKTNFRVRGNHLKRIVSLHGIAAINNITAGKESTTVSIEGNTIAQSVFTDAAIDFANYSELYKLVIVSGNLIDADVTNAHLKVRNAVRALVIGNLCEGTSGSSSAASVTGCTTSFAFGNMLNGVMDVGASYQPLDATLTALAALDSTAGLLTVTAADTFARRTIAGTAAEITVANGAGTAGDPTLSLPAALTFTGKTVTGGTFASPTAITGLPDPSSAQDAATKAYVDSVAAGLDIKPSVVCATTANITLSGEQTLDGVLTAASRVLVKNQSAAAENGIYVSAAGAWARATDMDAWTEVPGAFVFIEQGTLYADTAFVSTANTGGTLGATSVTWSQFSGAGTYTAGTGLILTGSQFSIDGAIVGRLATANTWALAQTFTTAPVFTDAAGTRSALGLVLGTNVQAYDADLAALAANSTDGLWAHTGAGTGAARTLTAPAAGITITNPAGIAGNPTLVLANDLAALEGLSGTGVPKRTATDTWSLYTAREILTANRTYYVRDADGSDSNDGLTNTSGGAFLTLQKAIDVVTSLDQLIYTVTIQLGDGNYSAGGVFSTHPTGPIIINGNSGTPANVVVDAATAISVDCVAKVTLQNFEAKGSSSSISLGAGADVTLGAGMRLTGAGISLNLNGLCSLRAGAVTVTIADSKTAWLLAAGNSSVVMAGTTLTFSGGPAWSSYGIGFNTGATVSLVSVTMSGAATGYRYYGTTNAALNSAGAGTLSTYFPGGSDGILESGAVQI